MRCKTLSLPFIFFVLLLLTISISPQQGLQANEEVEIVADVIWTQWDAANFTLIDDDPLLWVGTGSGLVKYEKATGDFSRISIAEGLPLRNVYAGAVDGAGNRWFGGDTGLAKLDSKNKWTHYHEDNSGLFRDHVDKIALAANGDLLLGHGQEEKISHMRVDGFWKIYPNAKRAVEQAYSAVKQTTNHNKLWAVSGDEVWVGYEVYNGSGWETRLTVTGGYVRNPRDIQADSQGYIWALEGDGVLNWDGEKWIEYPNEIDIPYFDLEDEFLVMAIDDGDNVWVGGLFYYPSEGRPLTDYEDTYYARLPDEPGPIKDKIFVEEVSYIRALLPVGNSVWAVGRDWFLKPDGQKSTLNALPNRIASVFVDHGGNTWLHNIYNDRYNDYHYLKKFDDHGTGTMNDDQLSNPPFPRSLPSSNTVIELVNNGDFWLKGMEIFYGGTERKIPPRRYHNDGIVEYDYWAAKPLVEDIFSEDAQHTWFVYAGPNGDQENFMPVIVHLDDGGTPTEFQDDRWSEYLGPHPVNAWEDLQVAAANGRLWYGDSSGVYLYLDPGWEQLTIDSPKRLVPTALGTLFVDLGEDIVLAIKPDESIYYPSAAAAVFWNTNRILQTSRSNEMWTVTKDGAIWYWEGDNQLIREHEYQKWSYESPIGRHLIHVDRNNHVWMTHHENLWRMSPRPDFKVNFSHPTWYIKPKESSSENIITVRISGFDGEISLRASQLPPGVTAVIEPQQVGVGETAVLTLIAGDIPLGTYSFKIQGISRGITHSKMIKIHVVEELFDVKLPIIVGY